MAAHHLPRDNTCETQKAVTADGADTSQDDSFLIYQLCDNVKAQTLLLLPEMMGGKPSTCLKKLNNQLKC